MKELIKTYRLYLGELLLGWALSIMPDGEEKIMFAEFLIKYMRKQIIKKFNIPPVELGKI